MARKPAHLEMVGGKFPRQRVWEQIRLVRAGFTNITLGDELKIHPDTVRTYLKALFLAGIIVEDGLEPLLVKGARRPTRRFRLERDLGAEAPRLDRRGQPVTMGRGREQVWSTLRRWKGEFSPRELAAYASTDEHQVAEGEAGDYCKHLAKAGYLTAVDAARYRFIPARDSGPRPPMIQRLKTVYDPNLDQVVWQEEPRDE